MCTKPCLLVLHERLEVVSLVPWETILLCSTKHVHDVSSGSLVVGLVIIQFDNEEARKSVPIWLWAGIFGARSILVKLICVSTWKAW